jgi:hypothetical protein
VKHPLAFIGLVVNMVATLLLLWFPPTVQEYTADGHKISGGGAFSELPRDDEQRSRWRLQYNLRKATFRISMGLLLIGFALQMFDLIDT